MKTRGAEGWHSSVWGVIKRTLEAAYEDNIPFLASALSFDLILTAIPFLVLVLAVLGSMAQHQVMTEQITMAELLGRFMPTGGETGRQAVVQVEAMLEPAVSI